MKKILSIAGAAFLLAACSSDKGDVTINLPKDFQDSILVVGHITIENTVKAKSADDIVIVYDTLAVKDGVAKLMIKESEPAWYNIIPPVMARMQPEFYTQEGENLVVDILSFNPLDYTVTGSALMDKNSSNLKQTNKQTNKRIIA